MEWWGVYLEGDRKKRYLSYISENAAKTYAHTLNVRNSMRDVHFVAMEMWFLTDEKYNGEMIY